MLRPGTPPLAGLVHRVHSTVKCVLYVTRVKSALWPCCKKVVTHEVISSFEYSGALEVFRCLARVLGFVPKTLYTHSSWAHVYFRSLDRCQAHVQCVMRQVEKWCAPKRSVPNNSSARKPFLRARLRKHIERCTNSCRYASANSRRRCAGLSRHAS